MLNLFIQIFLQELMREQDFYDVSEVVSKKNGCT